MNLTRYVLKLFISISIFVCGASPLTFADSLPLKIGLIQSLTGIAAEDGQTVLKAVRLAVEDINLTRTPKIELLIEDDCSDSTVSVNAFYKLQASKVNAIIGATWDYTTNAIIPLSERYKIPLLSTSTLPESLEIKENSKYIYTFGMSVTSEALAFKQYLSNRRIKTLAYIYTNNNWGVTQLSAYQQHSRSAKIKEVLNFAPNLNDQNEWNTLVSKIQRHKPEALVLILNQHDLSVLIKKLREQKNAAQIFASKNLFDAFQNAGNKKLFEKVCFNYPLKRLRANKILTQHFRDKYNSMPRIYTDSSYQAVIQLNAAAEQALKLKTSLANRLNVLENKMIHKNSDNWQGSENSSSLVCIENQQPAIK